MTCESTEGFNVKPFLFRPSKQLSPNLKRLKKYIKRHLKGTPPDSLNAFLSEFDPALAQLLSIKDKSTLTREQFNALTRIYSLFRLHDQYEYLIQQYDGLLTFDQSAVVSKKFITQGNGKGVVNAYRILTLGSGECFFEKIYINSQADLIKAKWFNSDVASLIDDSKLCFPKVCQMESGEKLTRVLYQFVDIRYLPRQQAARPIFSVVRYLYSLRPAVPKAYKKTICDFNRSHVYQEGVNALTQAWLLKHPIKLLKIKLFELKLKKFPKAFAHGDLHRKNFTYPNLVFDWDDCGLYPLGFDVALTLSRYFHFESLNDLLSFLEKEMYETVGREEYPKFLRSVLYFCLVFYSRQEVVEVSESLKVAVANYLINPINA